MQNENIPVCPTGGVPRISNSTTYISGINVNPSKENHSHYYKDVSNYSKIDIYRILELFKVTDPCIQHAIKKLMVAGGRGDKSITKDIQEAIDSLVRWQNMRKEDNA